MYGKTVNLEELAGLRISEVTGLESGSDAVRFHMEDGRTIQMVHHQDCCEGVSVEDVCGDVSDLNDATIVSFREEVSDKYSEGYASQDNYRESFTWTFYVIQTDKGAVTIRWLGESNGFYSEGVDVEWEN